MGANSLIILVFWGDLYSPIPWKFLHLSFAGLVQIYIGVYMLKNMSVNISNREEEEQNDEPVQYLDPC